VRGIIVLLHLYHGETRPIQKHSPKI
jgi:hypothetical protein